LIEKIQGRIVPFDVDATERAAEVMASGKRKGRTMENRDTMIASMVISRNAILATRNTAHYSDLGSSVVNPWNL
jgi:predicted nucleic acid-binding protein